jgi:hypothetical protein
VQAKGWGEPNRNFWLGVYNGVLVNGGDAFFHSALVLAPFLAGLGAPAWVIGLIPAVRVGGWFLPQIFVATRLAHVPFKLPLYRRMSTLRVIALSTLTAAVLLAGDRPGLLVGLTLAMILVQLAGGRHRRRPLRRRDGQGRAPLPPRDLLGAQQRDRRGPGPALGPGPPPRARQRAPFPTDFGVVFLLGTILTGGAYLSFALVREPAGKIAVKEPLWGTLRRLPTVLRGDVSFRRYLRVRFLGLAALMAEPFYAIYALERLGPPRACSAPTSSSRRSPRSRSTSRSAAPPTAGATSASCRCRSPCWRPRRSSPSSPPTGAGSRSSSRCSAAGNSGMGIAAWNLLYAVSPEAERPLYVGVANSVLALPSLAPIAIGALLVAIGFQGAFLLAATLALASLAFAFRFANSASSTGRPWRATGAEGRASEPVEGRDLEDEHDRAADGDLHRLRGEGALHRVQRRPGRHDLGALAAVGVDDLLHEGDVLVLDADDQRRVPLAEEAAGGGQLRRLEAALAERLLELGRVGVLHDRQEQFHGGPMVADGVRRRAAGWTEAPRLTPVAPERTLNGAATHAATSSWTPFARATPLARPCATWAAPARRPPARRRPPAAQPSWSPGGAMTPNDLTLDP